METRKEERDGVKNKGVFYLEKLEAAFKECGEDAQSGIFRTHFKQTVQTLRLLVGVEKKVQPLGEAQRVEMPALRRASRRR